ncbi:MAG: NAD-dependent deacetylase [Alphaproteobacteria bacterium]|jgi:NAD-dependent deacetylase
MRNLSLPMFEVISHLKTINYPKIVVLSGAGISAESGIKTFRDNGGLWENHSVEEVASPEAFVRNPESVYRFYNARRQQLLSSEVHPNPAHIALTKLQKALQDNVVLVTQNVDNLHERGGCSNVIHMHGEIFSAKCENTNEAIQITQDLTSQTRCSCCFPSSSMRPDIVWFGEMPYHMDSIQSHLLEADLFVSIGTSGNVYPAAGFVQIANLAGAYSIELNLEPSEGQSDFTECHYGLASDLVPAFVDELCALLQV